MSITLKVMIEIKEMINMQDGNCIEKKNGLQVKRGFFLGYVIKTFVCWKQFFPNHGPGLFEPVQQL